VERDRLATALGLVKEEAERLVPVDEIGAVLTIDAEVPLSALTLQAAQQIRSLAPFGVGFSEPLFLIRGVSVRAIRSSNGKGPARARVGQAGTYRDALWFRAPKEFLKLATGATIDLVCHLQVDDWQGLQRPELRIRDWRPEPPLVPLR
jgi:single-stranded-DNA-specific exonuclease